MKKLSEMGIPVAGKGILDPSYRYSTFVYKVSGLEYVMLVKAYKENDALEFVKRRYPKASIEFVDRAYSHIHDALTEEVNNDS